MAKNDFLQSASSSKAVKALAEYLRPNLESALASGSASVNPNLYNINLLALICMMLFPDLQRAPQAAMAQAMVQALIKEKALEKNEQEAREKDFASILHAIQVFYQALNDSQRKELDRRAQQAEQEMQVENPTLLTTFLSLRFQLLRFALIQALIDLGVLGGSEPVQVQLNNETLEVGGMEFVYDHHTDTLRLESVVRRQNGEAVEVSAEASIEPDAHSNPILTLKPRAPQSNQDHEQHRFHTVGLAVAVLRHLEHTIAEPQSLLSRIGLAVAVHADHVHSFRQLVNVLAASRAFALTDNALNWVNQAFTHSPAPPRSNSVSRDPLPFFQKFCFRPHQYGPGHDLNDPDGGLGFNPYGTPRPY